MTAGVYIIRNKANGKVYVGSANNVSRRLIEHRTRLKCGTHANEHLLRAYRKYGVEQFSFEVLMLCAAQERIALEQSYMDAFRSAQDGFGYNMIPTCISPAYGEALSKSQRGGWAKFSKEERRAKQAHLFTPEARAKGVANSKAARHTPEYRAMRQEVASRTVATEATRKKNSDRLLRLWQDPEFRAARLAGLTVGRNKTNALRRRPR